MYLSMYITIQGDQFIYHEESLFTKDRNTDYTSSGIQFRFSGISLSQPSAPLPHMGKGCFIKKKHVTIQNLIDYFLIINIRVIFIVFFHHLGIILHILTFM